MAKKSTLKKKGSRKAPSGDIVFTENAVVITLDAAARRQAKRCIAKNGKITFSVKEHSVTKLPQLLDNGKQID